MQTPICHNRNEDDGVCADDDGGVVSTATTFRQYSIDVVASVTAWL